MLVDREALKRLRQMHKSIMDDGRAGWISHWQECADFILPRRYTTLYRDSGGRAANLRNTKILDSTGTLACNTLAAGMMNGITSPARPWFRLRIPSVFDNIEVQEWLDDTTMRMLFVMAESNFYNGMATLYADLSGFASATMLIHEDDEDVFRCYNYALGEYGILQNNRRLVDRLACEFQWRVEQIVNEFGLENCSRGVREAYQSGGARLNDRREICFLLEPNAKDALGVAAIHKYRHLFWEKAGDDGVLLRKAGFREWPAVVARWATIGNDAWGTGPAQDALSDIKQLQHMSLRKAQAVDKMVSPPMVADLSLKNNPTALLPNGVTYVPGSSQIGMRPAYQVQPPLGEMTMEIEKISARIREIFFNDLFKMISHLDTVRSATEIDARVEEKLVLLGPVLERFENEALDPALRRIFSIMLRKGLLLPPPEVIRGRNIQIQYVSILNDAQRAVGAAPIERYVAFIGNIAGAVPDVLDVPDWTELTLDYSERLGVPAKDNHTKDEIAERRSARAQQQEIAGAAEIAPNLAQAGKTLSETEVGGGANALQQLLGGI